MKQYIVYSCLIAIGIYCTLSYLPYLYAQAKTTLVEIKIVCTNDPHKPLTEKQAADKYLKGSKIIGPAFNTKKYTHCYILARKYKTDAAGPEIIKAVDNIALNVGGLERPL